MNSSLILNRFAIALYSALTSTMSGINKLRALILDITPFPKQTVSEDDIETAETFEQIPQETASSRWRSLQETLTSLLLWGILGFAAGYLIGMIRPW